MKWSASSLVVGLIIGVLIGGIIGWYITPRGAPSMITLKTAGSTTIYPLSVKWAEEYRAAFPMVSMQVAAGGSGQGQTATALGLVDFGASSSYPSQTYLDDNPTVKVIPVAADAIAIIVNNAVNGTNGVRFTCNQIISIFNGSITTWETFESSWGVSIEVTGNIEVYVRSEAGGTTATFGKWLEGGTGWTLGHKESISWPAQPNIHAVEGNPGVRSGVQSDTNAIGYVGLAFTEGTSTAALYNVGNGEWVSPSANAAKRAIPTTLSEPGASLMDSTTPGAYPVVRLLFYLVNTNYARQATLDFLNWALTTGQNPTWVQTEVGYLEIGGTGAQTLAQSIIASITPVTGLVPRFQSIAIFQLENDT